MNVFYEQLITGDPTKLQMKVSLIRKYSVKEGLQIIIFQDNSMQIIFGDNNFAYFIDPYSLGFTIIRMKTQEKYYCPIDIHKIMVFDTNYSHHLNLIDIVLKDIDENYHALQQ